MNIEQRQQIVELPPVAPDGVLNADWSYMSLVVPIARTNLVTNPSGELNVTPYSNMTITLGATQDSTQQYHGAYSISRLLTGVTDGIRYETVSSVSGTIYAASVKVLCLQAGISFTLGVYPSGGSTAALVTRSFRTTGKWQWVWVFWKETSTTTRALAVRLTSAPKAGGSTFYTDGWQYEACNAGEVFPTTYIDGDQESIFPAQFPSPYGWNGSRHNSTSYRTAQTRDGGRVVNFNQYKVYLTQIRGLGVAPPSHIVNAPPGIDGAAYQSSFVRPRGFSLQGRFATFTDLELENARKEFTQALNLDLTFPRQPVVLLHQRYACSDPQGDVGKIIASYNQGMEGDGSVLSDDVSLEFTNWFPTIYGNDQGMAITTSTDVSITNFTSLMFRDSTGVWSQLATSGGSADIRHIQRHFDGTYYIVGLFTTLGVAANRIVRYDPRTNTFTALGTGLNGSAFRVRIHPNGDVYVVGSFTTAGGVTVNRVARWDGSNWNALGGGATKGVDDTAQDVCFDDAGDVYITGQFLNAGGAAANRIVKWIRSTNAFQTLGTGLNVGTGLALTKSLGGTNIWVAGTFATANAVVTNGLAMWDGTTFQAAGAGIDPGGATFIQTMVTTIDGSIYGIGTFLLSGGAPGNQIVRWTGSQYVQLGSGLSANGTDIHVGTDGLLYLTGVAWTTINGGIPVTDAFAIWNGSAYILPDLDMPDSPTARGPTTGPLAELMVGFGTATGTGSGTAKAAAINVMTNGGTAETFPTFYITGPSSASSRLYNIRNYTTGEILSFDLEILEREEIVIQVTPTRTFVFSRTRGLLSTSILPGSSNGITLIKGANRVAVLVIGTVTMTSVWKKRFNTAAEMVY